MTTHLGRAMPAVRRRAVSVAISLICLLSLSSCRIAFGGETTYWSQSPASATPSAWRETCENLLSEVRLMTERPIRYDPAYVRLSYPMGDPPAYTGVCADLVIRGLRRIGRDLQLEVHEDLRSNFDQYPKLWNLRRADRHIDHRRVPNLRKFFERSPRDRVLARDAELRPCDLVIWDLGGGLTHIGWVSDRMATSGRLLILHHISGRPTEDDVLDEWPKLQRIRPRLLIHRRVESQIE